MTISLPFILPLKRFALFRSEEHARGNTGHKGRTPISLHDKDYPEPSSSSSIELQLASLVTYIP